MTFNSESEIITAIDELNTECIRTLNHQNLENAENLYHYTSLESAVSILCTGNIRFTDIRYCNDPSEFNEGLRILNKTNKKLGDHYKQRNKLFSMAVNYITASINLACAFSKYDDEKINHAKEFAKEIGIPLREDLPLNSVFVACFSEHQDNLRQWLPYADHGKGIALGFDGVREEVHNMTKDDQYEIMAIKAAYENDSKKEEYVENIYAGLFEILSKINLRKEEHFACFLENVIDTFLGSIIACKNPSYMDEKESRLFFIRKNLSNKNDIKYGTKNGVIRPYIDIPFEKNSLISITLGPQTERILNTNSLEKITRWDYPNCKINESKILYR